MLLAVDDGLLHGYLDFADICFLVALVLFFFAFVIRLRLNTTTLDGILVAGGLTILALGWLVL